MNSDSSPERKKDHEERKPAPGQPGSPDVWATLPPRAARALPPTADQLTSPWPPPPDGAAPDPFPTLPATFDRYRVLRLLGKGGMGAVYLARDTRLDRLVALKVPTFTASDDAQARERFLREARAAATVQHPNLCPVYDADTIDGTLFLTMAFLEGRTLADVIRANRAPLTERQVGALVRKLALALAEAHRKKVVHRDLKPGNVMLNPRGEPVIMDFGLARRGTRRDGSLASLSTLGGPLGDPALTRAGAVMGTPAYMAPEQAEGNRDEIGPSCDIYSLGVILYELLTGRLPFRGSSAMELFAQLLADDPKPPSAHRPDLDPKMEAICLKALAKKPEQRYRTMTELAGVLTDYLKSSGQAAAAGAAGDDLPFAEEAAPKKRRGPPRRGGVPAWVWIALTGGAGVAILAAVIWVVSGKPRPATSPDPDAAALRGLPAPAPNDPGEADPREADAALARSRDHYAREELGQAVAEAARAIQLNPKLAAAWLARGEARNARGDHREAIADCTEALRLDSKLGFAHTVRGVARANSDELDAGIDDLSAAIRLDPKDVIAYVNRAHFLTGRGDLALAQADYDALVRLEPLSGRHHLLRGKVRARRGDSAGARADFDQAVKLDPRLAPQVPPPPPPPPELAWRDRGRLGAGTLPAPVLTGERVWFEDAFKKKTSGFPDEPDRGYRNGGYVVRAAVGGQNSAQLPLPAGASPGPGGGFACEVVGKVTGRGSRWGLAVSDGGKSRFRVSIAPPGNVFFNAGLKDNKGTRLGPPQDPPPKVNKGKAGRGEPNRLLIVVRGRYLEVYVNNVAVHDPVLLSQEIKSPQVALWCRGGLMTTKGEPGVAEFPIGVIVRAVEDLPPLEKRGAVPKPKPK